MSRGQNTVQYGLIVQHQDLALKCHFLEFEAYSNAVLSLRLDHFYLCYYLKKEIG